MAGWHHRCNEHELGQTPGDGEGQGGLACCSPWCHKELGTTGQLNNNNSMYICILIHIYMHNKILRDNKHVSDKSMMDKIGVKIAIEISQNEA